MFIYSQHTVQMITSSDIAAVRSLAVKGYDHIMVDYQVKTYTMTMQKHFVFNSLRNYLSRDHNIVSSVIKIITLIAISKLIYYINVFISMHHHTLFKTNHH